VAPGEQRPLNYSAERSARAAERSAPSLC
jgi:hypothetical protein